LTELTQIVNVESADSLQRFREVQDRQCTSMARPDSYASKNWNESYSLLQGSGSGDNRSESYVLSFEADWKRVDKMARHRFGVSEDDQRQRLCR
jgi:hypothetical protein